MQAGKGAGDQDLAHVEAKVLRAEVEGGVEEAGARMRCLAFLDAGIGRQLSARLQAIGCPQEAEAVAALVAFGQSCAKVGSLLSSTDWCLRGYVAAGRSACWHSLQKL